MFELGLTTTGKVVWGKYAQVTNTPENDGCKRRLCRVCNNISFVYSFYFELNFVTLPEPVAPLDSVRCFNATGNVHQLCSVQCGSICTTDNRHTHDTSIINPKSMFFCVKYITVV
jgi:hypothetical protein